MKKIYIILNLKSEEEKKTKYCIFKFNFPQYHDFHRGHDVLREPVSFETHNISQKYITRPLLLDIMLKTVVFQTSERCQIKKKNQHQ